MRLIWRKEQNLTEGHKEVLADIAKMQCDFAKVIMYCSYNSSEKSQEYFGT